MTVSRIMSQYSVSVGVTEDRTPGLAHARQSAPPLTYIPQPSTYFFKNLEALSCLPELFQLAVTLLLARVGHGL